jgi:hypothetical protein
VAGAKAEGRADAARNSMVTNKPPVTCISRPSWTGDRITTTCN